MVAVDESLKPERLPRDSSVDSASALGVGFECVAATAALHFILFASPDKVVLVGIKREQHPEIAVGIHMNNEEVPIFLRADLNLAALARKEASVVIDPELDGRVSVLGSRIEGTRVAIEQQGQEQHGDHRASRHDLGYDNEITIRWTPRSRRVVCDTANRVPPGMYFIYNGLPDDL
jgi:hypothetical protein